MSTRSLLTIGEFARLCNTTKDTLYHYAEKGLLSPVVTSRENGYRYYQIDQLCDFDVIYTLKQLDVSLDEIKKYIDSYSADEFLELLNSKRAVLEQKELQLKQIRSFIEYNYDITKSALSHRINEPILSKVEAELLIVTPNTSKDSDFSVRVHECMHDHFTHCGKIHLLNRFPLGSIVYKDNAVRGIFQENAFFSPVHEFSPDILSSERLILKPAGRYITCYRKGRYDEDLFNREYSALMEYIDSNDLELAGDIYVYDLVSYLASGTDENYIRKYTAKIN